MTYFLLITGIHWAHISSKTNPEYVSLFPGKNETNQSGGSKPHPVDPFTCVVGTQGNRLKPRRKITDWLLLTGHWDPQWRKLEMTDPYRLSRDPELTDSVFAMDGKSKGLALQQKLQGPQVVALHRLPRAESWVQVGACGCLWVPWVLLVLYGFHTLILHRSMFFFSPGYGLYIRALLI